MFVWNLVSAFSTKYICHPLENAFRQKCLALHKARLLWKCLKKISANSYVVFPLLCFSFMFIQEIATLHKKASDPTDHCYNITLSLLKYLLSPFSLSECSIHFSLTSQMLSQTPEAFQYAPAFGFLN